jgi:flagellar protein FliS
MDPKGAQHYLRTKVLTATAEQLQLMLYDGAIRFAEQARPALAKKQFEQSFGLINRCQKIVTQLLTTLRPDLSPDLCKKLSALYNYTYRKLFDANVNHNIESLDEAIRILRYQRETWVMLMDVLAKQKAGAMAQTLDLPGPDPRMEARISMQG